MWFGWSLLCMALSWFCMYKCCLLILEVNLRYPRGASFDTLVKDTLGRFSNVINALCSPLFSIFWTMPTSAEAVRSSTTR